MIGVGCWMMVACTSVVQNPTKVDKLPGIYPDYVGVTIPAGIAPLNFNSIDDDIDCMDVVVKGSKGGEIHVQGDEADFDIADWHELTAQNKGGQLTVTVCIKKDGAWTQYKDFTVNVSEQGIDEWGLTYRRIAPGYALSP